MRIWVDADACPNPIKNLLYKAAERRALEVVLVANHHVRVPPSPYLRSIQVPAGVDVADHTIVERMDPGDLVITADVPLAAEVVAHGGTALNPRGTRYDAESVHSHLATRDLLADLRDQGVVRGGPPALSQSEIKAFADQLDRYLARHA